MNVSRWTAGVLVGFAALMLAPVIYSVPSADAACRRRTCADVPAVVPTAWPGVTSDTAPLQPEPIPPYDWYRQEFPNVGPIGHR